MNNLPKAIEPLELIVPLPLEWEISPLVLNESKCTAGYACKDGETEDD